MTPAVEHAAPIRRRARRPSARALAREQQIYEAAAEIFQRKGYAATSLQDIATEVGLLKGSLYYYIDSKEDLLYRISQDIHEHAMANLRAARAVPGQADARLLQLVRSHVLAFGRRLAAIRVFYTEYTALGGERRREIMAQRRQYEQFVYELLQEGIDDGSFCPEIDTRIHGNAILTMVNSVFLWYRPERDPSIEKLADVYAEFAVAGLRCGPDHAHQPGAPAG